MRSRLAAVLLLGCLGAAAGCSSTSSSTATPATSATRPAPASTAKNFQVTTPSGQVSLSLDGQLPPNWPSAFPVPPQATIAGSGSLGGSGSAALAAVYTTSEAPPDALAYYTGNSMLTTSGGSSVGAGEQYLGSVKVTAPYTGLVTVASRSGITYIVITLKNAASSPSATGS